MPPRVFGLETEYALVHDVRGSGSSAAYLPADLYDLVEPRLLAGIPHAACNPIRHRAHGTLGSLVELCEGYFLANGARIYFDHGHLEWATPETTDPHQAVVYDEASALELTAAASTADTQLPYGRIMIVKNNLDYRSNATYGCHENYSLRLASYAGRPVMKHVVKALVPFLVTRQLVCGAGRVGASCSPQVGFQLSSRADFITEVSSVQTREHRPIVNLRDEPLADSRAYARLHLILGDSNMSELSTYLKLGMTGLLLDMIEAGEELPNVDLIAPVEALHQVSRDLSFSHRLRLIGGTSETGLGLQLAYWRAVRDFVGRQRPVEGWKPHVIALWGEVLETLAQHGQESLSSLPLDWARKRSMMGTLLGQLESSWDEIDAWQPILAPTWDVPMPSSPPPGGWGPWVRTHLTASKWNTLETVRRQHALTWDDYARMRDLVTKLQVFDIRYHDIDPEWSLLHLLGGSDRLIGTDREFQDARQLAPPDTRAAVRAHAITLAHQQRTRINADWDRLYYPDTDSEIDLADPFSSERTVLDQVRSPHPRFEGAEDASPARPLPGGRLRRDADSEIRIVILDVEPSPDTHQ